jgi:hypothetical protein
MMGSSGDSNLCGIHASLLAAADPVTAFWKQAELF